MHTIAVVVMALPMGSVAPPKPVMIVAHQSATIQQVVALTFADEPFDVRSVGDGDAALSAIRSSKPAIAVVSTNLPKQDGIQICEAMSKDPTLRKIPVLLLKYEHVSFDADRATRAGCTSVLVLPLKPQELIAKVKELVAADPGKSK